ncbi:MAG: hypothetical protein HEQ22_01345 [Sphingopyxis sp.]|uniref:TIGR02466 family protein n=1 Tax=Sphingopyxis sp. TaxID=1908224 RepID=UPI003D80D3FC
MPVRSLFASLFYEADAGSSDLLEDLEHSCRQLAEDDLAGRRWSRDHGYKGYTSYASLNDLPERDPAFHDLKRLLDKEVRAFAKAAHFDLAKPLKLDSMWVNVLKPGGTHSGHIHPHSIVSGTFYVAVPPGSGALKLEDPRLAMLMAAPGRTDDAPEQLLPFIYGEPAAGRVFLWESWLRHEVMPHAGKGERISVSFNYR